MIQTIDTSGISASDRDQSLRKLKVHAKQVLKSRTFLGNYHEKRYVDRLRCYKDLITLNRGEQLLNDDIAKVIQHIQWFYEMNIDSAAGNQWIGYTNQLEANNSTKNCIWTTLDDEQNDIPFGPYWFQIKSIKITDQATEIQLKVLRSLNDTQLEITSTPPVYDSANMLEYFNDKIIKYDWRLLFVRWIGSMNAQIHRFFSEDVTVENFQKVIRFIGIFAIVLFASFIQLSKNLGEFTIRFIQEFTRFVHVATPIAITMIQTFGKIIGGLYILFAMMWRDAFGGPNSSTSNVNRQNISAQPISGRRYQSHRSTMIRSVPHSRNQRMF